MKSHSGVEDNTWIIPCQKDESFEFTSGKPGSPEASHSLENAVFDCSFPVYVFTRELMQFPLHFSFKVLAIAPQIHVTDASGSSVFFVRQKLLRFKEKVQVFSEPSMAQQVAEINADRVIDFNAVYRFTDSNGTLLGTIRRRGMRSLWKAHYELADPQGNVLFDIHEEKPLVKVLDSLLSEIPLVGLFSGYFLHPSYLISNAGGGPPIFRLQKQSAFFEGKFKLEPIGPSIGGENEQRIALGCMMLLLLERSRG